MIGTTIDGKYLVKRELGAGAMGAVYEAEHASTGRRVAVKVISAGDLTRDAQMVARFQREARAAGAIDTQHITQVLDAGMDAESAMPFLVMEYLVGEDLQHLIKRVGPLAPDLALRVVAQGCLGLQKAHEAHVVHRDMKPANLFLAKRDAGEVIVKLLDFGIAKVKMEQAQEVESAELTKTGNMLGSPLFMSPEQARGLKEIDHRTDIWSMGVVLYQALCGRTPYQHVTSLGALIIAICSEWPPLVQEFAPWVPQEVAAIVHRALRHNPDERFQSAQEMFAAIRQILPSGWGITDEMLAPLDQSARGVAAPKLALTAQLAAAQTNANVVVGGGTTVPGGGTAAGVTMPDATAVTGAKASSKAPLFVALGVLALAGIGGGAYVVTHPSAPPLAATATPGPAAPTVVTAAAPATTAPVVAPPPAQAARNIQVFIVPPDAQVEVDGQKATLKDGVLEIKGMLGDTYSVKVSKGKLTTTADVIITNTGSSVPKIELSAAPARASGSASAGAAPAGAPAVTAPPTPTGISTKFE